MDAVDKAVLFALGIGPLRPSQVQSIARSVGHRLDGVAVLASLHRLTDTGEVIPGADFTYRRLDRMIADVLRQGDASAPEVAARLGLPDPAVRRQLHAMLRAGSVALNGGSWRFVAIPLLSDAAACPARAEVG